MIHEGLSSTSVVRTARSEAPIGVRLKRAVTITMIAHTKNKTSLPFRANQIEINSQEFRED